MKKDKRTRGKPLTSLREVHDDLVKRVAKHYLDSNDFNGYLLNAPNLPPLLPPEGLRKFLKPLIESDRLVARYDDWEINPFIRRLPDEPIDAQLKMLEASNFNLVTLYPTPKELKRVVKASRYKGRPFTLMLALGSAQLDFCCFDLSVLEIYRNDPRYYYRAGDISGMISVSDTFHQSAQMPESDQVLLNTFGFAYDDDMNRAVAAFVCYLRDLSPEHQQIWNAKKLNGKYRLHPDYHIASIQGYWAQKIPILDAFTMELGHINKMAELMGKPPLFHHTFEGDKKPKGFTFLINPPPQEGEDI